MELYRIMFQQKWQPILTDRMPRGIIMKIVKSKIVDYRCRMGWSRTSDLLSVWVGLTHSAIHSNRSTAELPYDIRKDTPDTTTGVSIYV